MNKYDSSCTNRVLLRLQFDYICHTVIGAMSFYNGIKLKGHRLFGTFYIMRAHTKLPKHIDNHDIINTLHIHNRTILSTHDLLTVHLTLNWKRMGSQGAYSWDILFSTGKRVTENKRSSIWQLCLHWWHRMLSKWQLVVPPVTTNLSDSRYFVFSYHLVPWNEIKKHFKISSDHKLRYTRPSSWYVFNVVDNMVHLWYL